MDVGDDGGEVFAIMVPALSYYLVSLPPTMPTTLAETDMTSAIFWCIVLIGLLVAGFFVVSMIRKSMRHDDDLGPPGGFTLSDLRKLRDSGEISKEQYEKAIHGVVASSHASVDAKLPPSPK